MKMKVSDFDATEVHMRSLSLNENRFDAHFNRMIIIGANEWEFDTIRMTYVL